MSSSSNALRIKAIEYVLSWPDPEPEQPSFETWIENIVDFLRGRLGSIG